MITVQFLRALEKVLKVQVGLYNRLMELTTREYAAILAMDSDRLAAASKDRAAVVDEIQAVERSRRELVHGAFGESDESLEQQLLKNPFGPDVSLVDRNRIVQLVRDLRERVVEVRKLSAELQSISGFGLEMVNGCISLFHAAKQVRSQVYSARGTIAESMTPRYSRSETTIRQA